MIKIIFQGVGLGLVISITIGPAFLAIIQNGITRGFKSSLFMAMGISLSDITLITICYLGASTFFENTSNKPFIGLIGGVILIGYGLYSIFKKPENDAKSEEEKKRENTFLKRISSEKAGMTTYLLKGFFMNILNPFLLIFWLTAIGWVSANAPEGKLLNYTIAFFGGTITTVFLIDILKSVVGTRISKYLKPGVILWMNRIVGATLTIFGCFLILKVLTTFTV
ncbi:MAG: hypothetical protein CSA95_05325 [Bacteroidetes bacterium]|nr:MAG: hypothetical protein CSA95_05325 [Bacteroidota bacterium]